MEFKKRFSLCMAVNSLAGALLLASLLLKISGQDVDFCKGFLVGIIIGSFIYEIVRNKTSRQDSC